jgi:hypothetical protein
MKRVSIFGTTKTMKMSNKTAVDLLVDSLPLRIQNMYALEIENAKAVEKDQIKLAYIDGCIGEMYELSATYTAEQYYNATYGE